MGIIATDTGKVFVPAPEGLHRAVCVDAVDMGMQETGYGPKHKVRVIWQIPEEINPETQKPFQVSKFFTLSLNEQASLRKDLETWRGRKFTPEELKNGFDIEKLVGVNCQLQVIHNLSDDGKIWANVQAVIPAAKGLPALRSQDYVRMKDRPTTYMSGTTPNANSTFEEPLPF